MAPMQFFSQFLNKKYTAIFIGLISIATFVVATQHCYLEQALHSLSADQPQCHTQSTHHSNGAKSEGHATPDCCAGFQTIIVNNGGSITPKFLAAAADFCFGLTQFNLHFENPLLFIEGITKLYKFPPPQPVWSPSVSGRAPPFIQFSFS